MATPMQRSPVHNGVQTRLPPVRNWLELIRLKVSAKSPFAFSKSKGLESLRILARAGSKPARFGSAPVVSRSDLEVDAANASRSCSSNSQIVTDKTLKVSEINFATAAHRPDGSTTLDMHWVKRVHIWRKSYCGLSKWRLTKDRIFCRIRFESSSTARRAKPSSTTNAWSWKVADPPARATTWASTPTMKRYAPARSTVSE